MKKHELNVDFDWRNREGPYRLISEEQAAQYNREGFVVFENAFDDATINALLSEFDPMEESGGGVVDLAAFALRLASWSMQAPRSRNCIMLDEPFKHLSKNLHDKASEMIKAVSKKLHVQFIIIVGHTGVETFL